MKLRLGASVLFLAAVLGLPGMLHAADLVGESLTTFVRGTSRIEYFSLARLRTMPSYASLRNRYLVSHIRPIEDSLAALGIREEDIDEVVLSWQKEPSGSHFEGLLTGRLGSTTISDRTASGSVKAAKMEGLTAYCTSVEPADTCFVVLSDSLAAFGPQEPLATMLHARMQRTKGLTTDKRFVKLVRTADTQAEIWGVASESGVASWVRAWLPPPGNLQVNWMRAFQEVKAVVYSVNTGNDVLFAVKMDCPNGKAAERTRRVLQNLKRQHHFAKQYRNPNRDKPFEFMEIVRDGRTVLLKMAMGTVER